MNDNHAIANALSSARIRRLAAKSAYEADAGAANKTGVLKDGVVEDRAAETAAILGGKTTPYFEKVEELANASIAYIAVANPEALQPSLGAELTLRDYVNIRAWLHLQLEGALDSLHSSTLPSDLLPEVLSTCLLRRRDYLNFTLDLILKGNEILEAMEFEPEAPPAHSHRH